MKKDRARNAVVKRGSAADRRVRAAFIAAVPSKWRRTFRAALNKRPSRDGGRAAKEKFGAELSTVLRSVGLRVQYVREKCPEFDAWLDRTGHGDEIALILAFKKWADDDFWSESRSRAGRPGTQVSA